jgi:hypothetical protein
MEVCNEMKRTADGKERSNGWSRAGSGAAKDKKMLTITATVLV